MSDLNTELLQRLMKDRPEDVLGAAQQLEVALADDKFFKVAAATMIFMRRLHWTLTASMTRRLEQLKADDPVLCMTVLSASHKAFQRNADGFSTETLLRDATIVESYFQLLEEFGMFRREVPEELQNAGAAPVSADAGPGGTADVPAVPERHDADPGVDAAATK